MASLLRLPSLMMVVIDGIINEDKLGLDKIYIQAKRYNENKVREKEIRNFNRLYEWYTPKEYL